MSAPHHKLKHRSSIAALSLIVALGALSYRPIRAAEAETPDVESIASAGDPIVLMTGPPEMGRCPIDEPRDPLLPEGPITVAAGPGLNDWERIKLELARAAVAQAEREGTRVSPEEDEPAASLSPEEAEALKLQELRAPQETRTTLIDLLSGAPISAEDEQ